MSWFSPVLDHVLLDLCVLVMVQCEAIASLGLHMLRLASPGLRLRVVLRLASNRCRSMKFIP
jgi:hypothetical protein